MLEEYRLINHEFPWLFRIFAFMFGACWGSFLNVVIYRLPKKESVVTPGSHCSCGKPIAWYDNIPILSWFILRGKARCCDARFSFRYSFVEMLTGGLFLACWWLHQDNFTVVFLGFYFIALLIGGTFIDLDEMIIPEQFTVWGAIIGVLLSFLFPALHGYVSEEPWLINAFRGGIMGCVGASVGSGVILWIAMVSETFLKKETMGFGDVVFMGCIGAFCGWQGALFAIFGGALLGTFIVIPMMLFQKIFGLNVTPGKVENNPEASTIESDKEEGETAKDEQGDEEKDEALKMGTQIPFGPWLALGAVVYYIFMRDPVDAYFDNLISLLFLPLGG